jgi:hypothetical protein
MAMVMDSRSRRSRFYIPGAVLFDLKVTTIEAESLGVSLPDHSSLILKRGRPQSVPEKHHVD